MTHSRYLGIEPTYAGFGWIVFEHPERPVAWGLSTAVRDDAAWTDRLESTISLYEPETIVTADPTEGHRGERAMRLLDTAATVALLRGIWTVRVTKDEIRRRFPDAKRKHDIAAALAERFPELRPRLPRPRKPWTSEDPRMRIFDAFAAVIAALPTDPIPANPDRNVPPQPQAPRA